MNKIDSLQNDVDLTSDLKKAFKSQKKYLANVLKAQEQTDFLKKFLLESEDSSKSE